MRDAQIIMAIKAMNETGQDQNPEALQSLSEMLYRARYYHLGYVIYFCSLITDHFWLSMRLSDLNNEARRRRAFERPDEFLEECRGDLAAGEYQFRHGDWEEKLRAEAVRVCEMREKDTKQKEPPSLQSLSTE